MLPSIRSFRDIAWMPTATTPRALEDTGGAPSSPEALRFRLRNTVAIRDTQCGNQTNLRTARSLSLPFSTTEPRAPGSAARCARPGAPPHPPLLVPPAATLELFMRRRLPGPVAPSPSFRHCAIGGAVRPWKTFPWEEGANLGKLYSGPKGQNKCGSVSVICVLRTWKATFLPLKGLSTYTGHKMYPGREENRITRQQRASV